MSKKFPFNFKTCTFLFALFVLLTQTTKAQIANQVPTATPASICGAGTTTITIPSSEVGVTYAVVSGTTIVSGPTSGTGSGLSFAISTLSVTTTFIVGATDGTNTVTMTPAVTVTINPIPTVVITPAHTVICRGVVDTLIASGASTYTWSGGGSNAVSYTVNPIATTSYTLTGVDVNGCENTAIQTITVNTIPTVIIASSTGPGPTSICIGATATLTASGASTYTWNTSATTSTLAVNPTTTTIYTVVGTNTLGCSAAKTKTVTVNPTATITISGNSTICLGASTTLTGGGGSTYTWSTSATTASITVSPTVTTVYSVSGSGSGICPSTASQTVIVLSTAIPIVAIGGASVTCSGQTDVLTASGASTYTWSTGAMTNTISPVPTGTTSVYSVTGTDVNGCSATSTKTVTIIPLPNVIISGTKIVCSNDTTILTASGASTYTWSTSAATSTVALFPIVNTTYTVIGTGSNGCSKSIVATVTVNPLPVLSAPSQFICSVGTATLTASGAITYTWSPGLSSTNGTTVTGSPTITTTYTFSGTNANGCVATETTSINIVTNSTVSAVASNTIVCNGSSVTLTASGASAYSWTPSAGTISGSTGTTVTVTPSGSSTTYTVSGSLGTCSVSPYVITISTNILPTVSATSSTVCAGSTTTLTASGTAISYTWNTSETTISIAPTVTTTTDFTVTGTDANNCMNSAIAEIFVNALPIATGTAQSVSCYGLSDGIAGVNVSGGGTSYSYLWSPGGQTTATVTALTAGSYICFVTDNNNCLASTTINVSEPATISAIGTTTNVTCFGGSNGAINLLAIGGNGTYSYTWSPSGGTAGLAVGLPAGTYICTITDIKNCVGIATYTVSQPLAIVTTQTASVCSGQSITVGTNTYTTAGTYTAVLTAANTCDSTVITTLNVNALPNNSVTQTTNVLTASNTSSTYQWIDCSTHATISGATNQTYTATTTGSYQVMLTESGCIDTSTCYAVTITGIKQLFDNGEITIYPNPSNGIIFIKMNITESTNVEVYNALGQNVFSTNISSSAESINLGNLNQGIYLLRIKQNDAYVYQSNVILK